MNDSETYFGLLGTFLADKFNDVIEALNGKLDADSAAYTFLVDNLLEENAPGVFTLVEGIGEQGDSVYDTWLLSNVGGTEGEFLIDMEGAQGEQGDSAYEVWESQADNTGQTEPQYLASLVGPSAHQVWQVETDNAGNAATFLASLTGDSAFDVWAAQEANFGQSPGQFLASLQGAAFTYADFTGEQLTALQVHGNDFQYSDFTEEQLAALQGDSFRYSDFTEEQLAALQIQGAAFTYSDFTDQQLTDLTGDSFTFEDLTDEQIATLHGNQFTSINFIDDDGAVVQNTANSHGDSFTIVPGTGIILSTDTDVGSDTYDVENVVIGFDTDVIATVNSVSNTVSQEVTSQLDAAIGGLGSDIEDLQEVVILLGDNADITSFTTLLAGMQTQIDALGQTIELDCHVIQELFQHLINIHHTLWSKEDIWSLMHHYGIDDKLLYDCLPINSDFSFYNSDIITDYQVGIDAIESFLGSIDISFTVATLSEEITTLQTALNLLIIQQFNCCSPAGDLDCRIWNDLLDALEVENGAWTHGSAVALMISWGVPLAKLIECGVTVAGIKPPKLNTIPHYQDGLDFIEAYLAEYITPAVAVDTNVGTFDMFSTTFNGTITDATYSFLNGN
jgi:uncharacterized protein YjbI with pentapeptide repeats